MLSRLVSNIVSSFKNQDEENDVCDDNHRAKSDLDSPEDKDDVSYVVALYHIAGTNVERLVPQGELVADPDKIWLSTDDKVKFEWPLDKIISLRQYRTTSAQFRFNKTKDEITEYGLHFQNERAAHSFMSDVLISLLYTTNVLFEDRSTIHMYNNETRAFDELRIDCFVSLHQRAHDGIAFLTARDSTASLEDCAWIVELSPETQIWCSEKDRQFSVWGSVWAARNDDWKIECGNPTGEEITKSLLQFSMASDNPATMEELFLILNKLIRVDGNNELRTEDDYQDFDMDEEEEKTSTPAVETTSASGSHDKENRQESAAERKSSDYTGSIQSVRDSNGMRFERHEERRFSELEFAQSEKSSDESESDKDLSRSSALFDSSSVTEESDLEEIDQDEIRDLRRQVSSGLSSHYRKPGRVSISMDPSYAIIEKDSTAKLHRFMQVGQEKSFVCRSTDIDNDGSIHWKPSSENKATDFELVVYGKKNHSHAHIQQETAISGSKFKYKRSNLVPTKGLLHDSGTKLIMTNKNDLGSLYYMDLERETVVQRFETKSTSPHILWNTFKGASITHDPTFLCATNRSFALMDARAKPCEATKHELTYATNPQFSAGASDSHGHFVVGNRVGQLRLYDGEPNQAGKMKMAKTQLDCIYKEPIKAVDTTSDGSWVLATMRTCLVLFPTKLKSTATTGFVTRLGQNKPPGLYLRLKQEDILKYQLEDIDFQPAVFDSIHKKILTSTGNLNIMWDFQSIKRGNLNDYKLKILPHYIKESRTLVDGSVVVAFPTDLGVVSRNRLGARNKKE